MLITILKHGGKISMAKTSLTLKTTLLSLIAILMTFPFFSDARATEKKVAVLPLALYADPAKAYLRQGIKSMLASRLPGEGLQVIGDQALAPFLREGEEKNGITSPERAGELAELVKADYAVFGSITGTGTGYSLDLSILDRTREQPGVTNVSEAVTEDQLIPKMADVVYDFRAIVAGMDIRRQAVAAQEGEGGTGLFSRPSEEALQFKPAGRISLRVAVMSFDMGDLDGDGNEELIVLSRESLQIFKKKGPSYELKDTLNARRGEEFLKVGVADLDKDGKADICLVSFFGSRAQSSIWGWKEQFAKKVDFFTGHLHVAGESFGRSHRILFQGSNVTHFFDGKIFMMEYEQEGKLTKKDPLPKLEGAQLYTLLLHDVDRDGGPDFIGLGTPTLNEESPIQAWSMQGDLIWRSEERVGGTNNVIRFGQSYMDDPKPRVSFNGRLVVHDTGKEGKKELLAITNVPVVENLKDFKLFTKGYLTAYEITSSGLIQPRKSRTIDYCITDIQTSGSKFFIAAQKGQALTFADDSSRIMWFE